MQIFSVHHKAQRSQCFTLIFKERWLKKKGNSLNTRYFCPEVENIHLKLYFLSLYWVWSTLNALIRFFPFEHKCKNPKHLMVGMACSTLECSSLLFFISSLDSSVIFDMDRKFLVPSHLTYPMTTGKWQIADVFSAVTLVYCIGYINLWRLPMPYRSCSPITCNCIFRSHFFGIVLRID